MDEIGRSLGLKFLFEPGIRIEKPLEEKIVKEPSAEGHVAPCMHGTPAFKESEIARSPSEIHDEDSLQGLRNGDVTLLQMVQQGSLRFLHELWGSEASLPGGLPDG